MILILSNKWDLAVDFVVRELRRRNHPFLRLNTEDFISERATVTLPNFHLLVSKGAKSFDLTQDIRVIWNRRPGKPFDNMQPGQRPSAATQRFVNDQWYSWLEALQLLPDVTWINHPQASYLMESKIRQLWLASSHGFSIPTTIVSNDPDAARSIIAESSGRTIVKALYSPLIEEPEQDFFIFTNMIASIDTSDDMEVRLSPSIFQEAVIPKIDYRVTVVGDVVIPVKIESESGAPVALDWRTQQDGLLFQQCRLPADIEDLCRDYVQRSGLLFGAIDLVERDGQFYFLEINQNGEWGWLQKPNGVPVAEALCHLMISKDTSKGNSSDQNH